MNRTSEVEAVEQAAQVVHRFKARIRELEDQLVDRSKELELERREADVLREILAHMQARADFFADRDVRARECLRNMRDALDREIARAGSEQPPMLAIAERQEADDTARVERVVEGIRRINGGERHTGERHGD